MRDMMGNLAYSLLRDLCRKHRRHRQWHWYLVIVKLLRVVDTRFYVDTVNFGLKFERLKLFVSCVSNFDFTLYYCTCCFFYTFIYYRKLKSTTELNSHIEVSAYDSVN